MCQVINKNGSYVSESLKRMEGCCFLYTFAEIFPFSVLSFFSCQDLQAFLVNLRIASSKHICQSVKKKRKKKKKT